MSASREKKARQEFNASGAVDPKAAREAQERAKQRRSNWLYGGIAIVFVLVAAALLVWNSNVIQRGSAAVTVEGRVNTDVPGDYTLTYQADFRGRSYTAKRLVHVEDREAPELTLTGQAEVTVSRYDLFQDPGATARDRCDGDLTASIQVTDKASGDVHTLTYTVTDKAGNAATATRRVTVRDIVAPVITLSGQRELFVPLGGAYQEPGYTAQDDADGDLTASVTRAGTVNTASPGVYTLTYTVTDKAGNTATATRQVSVYENSSGGSPVYLTFDDGPATGRLPGCWTP